MFKQDTAIEGIESVKAFIADKSFPCVGAKSALNKDRMRLVRFGAMADPASTQALWRALIRYSQEFPDPGSEPVSFVAVFDNAATDKAGFDSDLGPSLEFA